MSYSQITILEISHSSNAYRETVALRTKVLREPLGMNLSEEALARETDSIHLAMYQGEALVACVVLKPLSVKEIKMRQMAVDDDFQGMGYGKQLVQAAEAKCREKGYEQISLHARNYAVAFYRKLGYEIVGEPFEEVGIKHFKMVKELDKNGAADYHHPS